MKKQENETPSWEKYKHNEVRNGKYKKELNGNSTGEIIQTEAQRDKRGRENE